mmetsp:Transcript_25498/g.59739  ORF Transcript_25498/g.59739 Transcript_25498/m.59739 type:complete len:392 (+) Transcript_25498:78-1253(+)
MSGVTWGNNTVHAIGGATFSATAPASGPPATTAGTGAFGFGATGTANGPAKTSLFGTPAPANGAFGSLGQQQQPPVPQHRIPAQAAIQAKMTAERVVEAERIRNKIEKLHREYSGTCIVPEDGEESAKFVAVVYNELTPEERQFRMIHGMATGQPQYSGIISQSYHDSQQQQQQPIFAPQRPPQINSRDWKSAVVNNPDPYNYVPTPIVGAVALQGRISNQQNRAKEYANNAVVVQKILEFIRQREAMARQDLMEKDRQYTGMRRRLLELMTRVEVARCLNKPLQADENRVMQRLSFLLDQVERLRGAFFTLQDHAIMQSLSSNISGESMNANVIGKSETMGMQNKQLLRILTEQRRKLEKMNETAKEDLRDVGLIGRRVVRKVPYSIANY